MKPETRQIPKDMLLEWFKTLDRATLQKAWNFIMVSRRGKEKRERAVKLELELIGFLKVHPKPSEDEWKAFANYLKNLGLYKSTTANCDIIWRMKRGTYGPKKFYKKL